MRYILLFIILFQFGFKSFGQDDDNTVIGNISTTDSSHLIKVWKNYVKAIERKDLATIKYLSLNLIDCDICSPYGPWDNLDKPVEDGFIEVDTFAFYFFKDIVQSKLWKVVKSTHPSISTFSFHGYYPRSLKLKRGDHFYFYELTYITWKPGEAAEGHEGQTQSFIFVKIKNRFKFFGITSTSTP